MISSLHGRLESLGSDWVVINVNGIGFRVNLPASALSALGARGGEVHLHTYFHLKEDGAALYGFSTPQEREFFQLLLSVSGVGPRLAMAVLSALSVEEASLAITAGNADMLTAVPGIGNKTASRLILELKDKIGAGLLAVSLAQVARESTDVIAALTSLGYSAAEAARAIATLPRDKSLGLEERIKLALQYLGGK